MIAGVQLCGNSAPCIVRNFSFTSVKNNLANAARCEETDAHPDDLGVDQG